MRHCLAAVCATMVIGWAAPPARADEQAELLLRANIKFTRDAAGNIVSVELPSGARDFHIEALLDIPTITEVKAPRCLASTTALKQLQTLPALAAINLDGVQTANDYAACLARVRNLRGFSISSSWLTDAGLSDIAAAHPSLTELNVADTYITDLALPTIENLRDLRVLDISNCPIMNGGPLKEPGPIAALANLPHLEKLNAIGIEFRNADLYPFGTNCRLQHFNVTPHRVSGGAAGLVYLQNCCPSVKLGPHIAAALATPYLLDEHGNIRELRSCSYKSLNSIPSSQLVHLQKLTVIGATDLGFLKTMPTLIELTLEGIRIDNNELLHLNNSPKITVLTIARSSLSPDIAASIVQLRHIRAISVRNSAIDPVAVKTLRSLPTSVDVRINP